MPQSTLRRRPDVYSYDRRKTAATMDFHAKWDEIVMKHAQAERHDFDQLLQETVKYLRSVGYDLDLSKSYLGKEYHGSDGIRMSGELYVTERAENTVKHERPEGVAKWIKEALQLHTSPRKGSGEYAWVIDISES